MLTVFYINRDNIYNFLRGGSRENRFTYGGLVPLLDDIPDPHDYFSNIVFLGDSIISGLDIYRDSIEFEAKKF
ncbi:MAG: hypothetical protein FWD71_16655 [Oscillospiraceae bacterium]|nr:hypothetical protein [Oscillospiraceae bacterium]